MTLTTIPKGGGKGERGQAVAAKGRAGGAGEGPG